MSESKFKTCPFCGSEPKTSKFKIDDGYYCEMYCEGCNCGIISAGWSEPQEAEAEVIERWNKRVGD